MCRLVLCDTRCIRTQGEFRCRFARAQTLQLGKGSNIFAETTGVCVCLRVVRGPPVGWDAGGLVLRHCGARRIQRTRCGGGLRQPYVIQHRSWFFFDFEIHVEFPSCQKFAMIFDDCHHRTKIWTEHSQFIFASIGIFLFVCVHAAFVEIEVIDRLLRISLARSSIGSAAFSHPRLIGPPQLLESTSPPLQVSPWAVGTNIAPGQ